MEKNTQKDFLDVDKEIQDLEKKFSNGEESKKLYKLKIENLKTIKEFLNKSVGRSQWDKSQGD